MRFAWTNRGTVATTAATVAVAAWVFWQAQSAFRADSTSMRARHDVAQWVSGASRPENAQAWSEAREALEAALRITPDDPDLVERLADLHAVAGQGHWHEADLRRRSYREAARLYRQAIALRPTEATTWAMLAAAAQASGEEPGAVHAAWARALTLGPHEGTVQPVLMQVVLSDWDGASPLMKNWAERLFDLGNEATRRDINALAARYGLKFVPDEVTPPPMTSE